MRAETITAAWREQNEIFKSTGVEPTTYIMDSEASKDLKDTIKTADVKYKLVPPHNHRTDLFERAIETFKAHSKVGLASLYPNFPLKVTD